MLEEEIEVIYQIYKKIGHDDLEKTRIVREFIWKSNNGVPSDEFLAKHEFAIEKRVKLGLVETSHRQKRKVADTFKLLPSPLMGQDSKMAVFTEISITQRLPAIIISIIDSNDWMAESMVKSLKLMEFQLREGLSVTLQKTERDEWKEYKKLYNLNLSWSKVPWFFVENLFYHEILEIIEFRKNDKDPFAKQKIQSLTACLNASSTIPNLKKVVEAENDEVLLLELLTLSLFGNFHDLSFSSGSGGFKNDKGKETLIVDHSESVISYIRSGFAQRVCIILDNCGSELFYDLLLAHNLIEKGFSSEIVFYAKKFPVFVSDVMIRDIKIHIDMMMEMTEYRELALKFKGHLRKESWIIKEDDFFTSPLPLWEMNDDLYTEFGVSNLCIFKGDANYRRSIGDLHWDFTINQLHVWRYLPSPALFLRTCKSGVQIGLDRSKFDELCKSSTDWSVNGTKSVIQFHKSI